MCQSALDTHAGRAEAAKLRRQVHGHDFSCVASIPAASVSRFLYAAGSEEKVIRVFEAPRAFIQTLAAARGGALPQADMSSAEPMASTVRSCSAVIRPAMKAAAKVAQVTCSYS